LIAALRACRFFLTVMPAHAGIHALIVERRNLQKSWMPACAGMTN